MTATPIPRTLAMSFYSDLDVSVIDEMPVGRKPIITAHRREKDRLSVFRFAKEEIEKGRQIYSSAPEVQILDNENASDNKIDSHLAGSLYDMLPADPKTVNPYGQWNTIVIRVDNGRVTHTQNGVKIVEYRLWTRDWDRMVENSKFKSFPGFKEGISKEGFIGLQDHGYAIWFRNVKIREL